MQQSVQFYTKMEQRESQFDLPLSRDQLYNCKRIRSNSNANYCHRLEYDSYVPHKSKQNKQNFQSQHINTLQLPLQMTALKDFRKDFQLTRQNRPLQMHLCSDDKKIEIKDRNYQNSNNQSVESSIKTDSKVYQIRISNQLKKEVSKIYGQLDLQRIQSICSVNKYQTPSAQFDINSNKKTIIKQRTTQKALIPSIIKRSNSMLKLDNQKPRSEKTKYQQILDQVFNTNLNYKSIRSVKNMKTNAQIVQNRKYMQSQHNQKSVKDKMIEQVKITRSVQFRRHFSQKNIRENHKKKVVQCLKSKITQRYSKSNAKPEIKNTREVFSQKKSRQYIYCAQQKQSNCYLQKYYKRIRKIG